MILAFRILPAIVPTIDELQLPEIFKQLSPLEKGLVVVSGSVGSSKTTTHAEMIRYINDHETRHILSLEDPIEYCHQNIKSKIIQREWEMIPCRLNRHENMRCVMIRM